MGEMEWKKISLSDSVELNKVIVEILNAIKNKDTKKIKDNSLEQIDCSLCIPTDYSKGPRVDNIIPVDTFINQAYINFINSPLYQAIKKRGFRISEMIIPDFRPRNLPNSYGKDLVVYEAWVQTYLPNEWAKGHEGQSHCFQFVKINNAFRLYGLTSIP